MSKLSRLGWGSMAALFLLTSATFTILAIISLTSKNDSANSGIQCSQGGATPNQQPLNGKIKGAQLADFKPPQKVGSIACVDYKFGSGAAAKATSTITVLYIGALAANGKIFDDSFDTGKPLTIQLSQVIPGWSIGVPGMKIGGLRRLLIPAQLGYGAQAIAGIPANSDLVFDIQLLNVQ